jgi:4-hydroxy-2-oxoheptanedioate aldolase
MRRKSRVLEKFRSGKVARLCALASYIPYFPTVAAKEGFDGVWVDGEHKPFDPREIQALVGFHHLADVDCLWRAPTREKAALYRILEDGATGLIIPHVESVEEARSLVRAVKFPPVGNRGLDGAALDADYGFAGGSDYPANANWETLLLVQIETPEALEEADAMAAIPGVDGIFVGPADMALRLGCSAAADDPKMAAVYRRIAAAAAKHQKAWGCPALSIGDAELLIRAGAGFIVHGAEVRLLRMGLRQCGEAFDRLLGENLCPRT